jgi:hypothetical protein
VIWKCLDDAVRDELIILAAPGQVLGVRSQVLEKGKS